MPKWYLAPDGRKYVSKRAYVRTLKAAQYKQANQSVATLGAVCAGEIGPQCDVHSPQCNPRLEGWGKRKPMKGHKLWSKG